MISWLMDENPQPKLLEWPPKTPAKVPSEANSRSYNSPLFCYLPSSFVDAVEDLLLPFPIEHTSNTEDGLVLGHLLLKYLEQVPGSLISPDIMDLLMEAAIVHLNTVHAKYILGKTLIRTRQEAAKMKESQKLKKKAVKSKRKSIGSERTEATPTQLRSQAHLLASTLHPLLSFMEPREHVLFSSTIMFLNQVILPQASHTTMTANFLAACFANPLFKPSVDPLLNSFYFKHHKEILKALIQYPPPQWILLWKIATTKISFDTLEVIPSQTKSAVKSKTLLTDAPRLKKKVSKAPGKSRKKPKSPGPKSPGGRPKRSK